MREEQINHLKLENNTNITEALQLSVDKFETTILPEGRFFLDNSILLSDNTSIIGCSRHHTQIEMGKDTNWLQILCYQKCIR